ncbi:FHA domain-containing protein [Giardia muris]|uniref:FHA domain-containing protein n=1 Tax=Giardia muris TaxID=5742 RepID=A0A4Z1SR03_GIAMU|nr:FHA domain-containing protein [Giardia muris]|eukprot:TNJ28130.1 FHA domain-containing protein [Giardia muris]
MTENDITAWIDKLRVSTQRRFFLGHIRESANADLTYDKPVAFRVCLIGRAPSCDITLTDSFCSRRHAILYFQDGTPMIRDLDSRTGTTVNNIVLVGGRDYPLAHGDIISIVGERFAFIYEDDKPQDLRADRSMPEVGIRSHSCPYCFRFIPEFSAELRTARSGLETISASVQEMELSYKTVKLMLDKLTEQLELVHCHHDAYHEELLVEAQARRKEELEATRVADSKYRDTHTRVLRETMAKSVADDSDYQPSSSASTSSSNASSSLSSSSSTNAGEGTIEPELKQSAALHMKDLASTRKRQVQFAKNASDVPVEKKQGVLSTLVSSLSFWKRDMKSSADSKEIEKHVVDASESGSSSSYTSSGTSSSSSSASSKLPPPTGRAEPVAPTEPTRTMNAPKKFGKDTPAPPKYTFDGESESA